MSAGMEQSLGMSLQQTLSPQMQQSLHILQAPIPELRQMVAAELAENPALEEVVPTAEDVSSSEAGTSSDLDDAWGEVYGQAGGGDPWTSEAMERRQFFFDSQTRVPTLQEFLLGQLATEDVPGRLVPAARVIIGHLDEAGYYRGAIEEAAYPLGLTVAEAEEALGYVQGFDPPGVAARDLAECLELQLRREGTGSGKGLAVRIVHGHLEDLARRRLPEIARALGVPQAEVVRAAAEIRDLNPRPGLAFARNENLTIIPDVFVRPDGDDFVVGLNESDLPHVRVSDSCKDMVTAPGQSREVREFLRDKIRGGRFLIKCIEQRQQTILSIAREIVARQADFFRHGPSHLRPMTMAVVAEAVGVHETTVSRAVSGKYMECPQGVFELKYFFTTGYTTEDGATLSNESVRAAISEIVKAEDARKPLSDQDLVNALAERGLRVARRTVAKYREQLGILPSNLRRQI
jgi:RNA polymerase sigma-54 factor